MKSEFNEGQGGYSRDTTLDGQFLSPRSRLMSCVMMYPAEYMKARLRAEQCPPRAYNRTGWITRTEARMREYISFDSHKYYTLMGGLDG